MTVKTGIQLNAYATANLPDNASGQINAVHVRTMSKDLADSIVSARGVVSPYYDYGAVGDNSANDRTALDTAIATGRVIDLTAINNDYRVTSGLFAGSNDLYLTGKGTIWFPRNDPALTFEPTLGPSTSIVAFANVQHPAGLSVPVTRIQVGAGLTSRFAIGNIVVFRSTTLIGWGVTPGEDAGRGEEAEVIDINAGSNWVYLNRILQWVGTPCAYDGVTTAGNTCRVLSDKKLYIGPNINFECYEDVEAVGARDRAAIMVIGARYPEIYGHIRSSPTRGWMIVGCWKAVTDLSAKRCRDDLSLAAYGYGVSLAGACYGCSIKGVYEECRHPVSTNTYPDASDAFAGAPQECTFHDSVVLRSSATAYDNHAGALRTRYINNRVHGMAANATGSSAGLYCMQDRGLETEVDGLWSVGFPSGLYFQPNPPPSGSNFVAGINKYVNKYRNVHCTAGNAEETALGSGIPAFASSGGADSQWMKIEIQYSTFRGMDPVFSAVFPELEISYTKMTDCGTFRCGANRVKFMHCTLENTVAAAKEGIQFTNNAYIVAATVHFEGVFSPTLFRNGSASGSGATLKTGGISHAPPSGAVLALRGTAGATYTYATADVLSV